MRVWLEVYDPNGAKLNSGPVRAIKSATVTEQLDGAGTYSLDLTVEAQVLSLLVNDNEIRLQVQQQDTWPVEEWVRGLIRDVNTDDQEGGTRISISGPDTLDALTERTVGIGISYQNQSITTIVNSLLSFVPGWTASIASAIASDLQTDRFDGAHIFRCIKRLTEEKGVHFRNGLTTNTLEIGAFGSAVTTDAGEALRAIKPPSEISQELRGNPAVMLIERISKKKESDNVVNWAIPIGAGEGSAALTLKDTTYAIYNTNGSLYRAGTASRYPIYRRVNFKGIAEYYIDASAGARQRQATVSFKEIGAVANSKVAKQLAANMLANATMAYLDRQKVALSTYRLSAKDVKVRLRPGDLLKVDYKGQIEVIDETRPSAEPVLTYLDVNESMWVMKVTRRISDGQISHDYEVATIDRYAMDSSKILVSLMDAVSARNVNVGTQPYNYDNTWQDSIAGLIKNASFPFVVNSFVTDLPVVIVHWKTLPLWIPAFYIGLSPPEFNWEVRVGYNYPSDVRMFVNGTDVTPIYGPSGNSWNLGGTNAPLDVTCDISSLIEAAPDLYQTHTIHFTCGTRVGPVEVYAPPRTNGGASTGLVELSIFAQGHSRGV